MGGCWWGGGCRCSRSKRHTIVIYFRVDLQRNLKRAVVSCFSSSRKRFNLRHLFLYKSSNFNWKKCYFCFYSHCNTVICTALRCVLCMFVLFPQRKRTCTIRERGAAQLESGESGSVDEVLIPSHDL